MVRKKTKDQVEYILPLYINGLSGRMLRLPAPARKKREFLLVPGHHTSIERLSGLSEYLNDFGGVTLPDMPGFGGMESFYKIGEKPTIDNLADYLASFIKLRYRNRRFSILAISFGFAIVTRMLQKYPEIADKVDLLISWAGFVNGKDFKWKKSNLFMLRQGSRIFSKRIPAAFGQYVLLSGPIIRASYHLVEDRHPKFKGMDKKDQEDRINFEIVLWKINDLRTYMATIGTMFKLNLYGKHVNLPVYHIGVDTDQYFNNLVVEQHMRHIFKDFILIKSSMTAHAPTVIASKKDIEPYIPRKLKLLLKKRI
jgi:pimeloyl-ACP methyl ester carboxylesterase